VARINPPLEGEPKSIVDFTLFLGILQSAWRVRPAWPGQAARQLLSPRPKSFEKGAHRAREKRLVGADSFVGVVQEAVRLDERIDRSGVVPDDRNERDLDSTVVRFRRRRLAGPRVQLFVGERYWQREHPGGIPQTPHVPVEEERLTVVRPPRFVHTFAVQKAVIEDRDQGMFLVHDPPVDIDRRRHRLERTIVFFQSRCGS
jgi:hypothetical protein